DGKISFYTLPSKTDQAETKKVDDNVSDCTPSKASDKASRRGDTDESDECDWSADEPENSAKEVVKQEPEEVEEKDPGNMEVSDKEEDCASIYFHNVPFEVHEEDLLPLFERAGHVEAMGLFRLSDRRSRGQGLCKFSTSAAANKAVRMLNGCFLANPQESNKDSREMRVKIHEGSTSFLDSSAHVACALDPSG
ncbi:unnamed protein product, partial [Effrenium voratum]